MAISVPFKCRVSSTLNDDVQNFGKNYMFDENEETCWNSAEGSPQWIEILFKENQQVSEFQFQFQGGFVGQDVEFRFFKEIPSKSTSPDIILNEFYPEDVNSVQTYNLNAPADARSIRILFNSSTDTYGRVIIYKLSISTK
ncbi:nuclear receptor 2C2-associated protein [Planococcus citri]|uniref:nuclear receptor 2C2-associated protein n=1 Tax=Planococcus citri TaxID=170843 RepID=UPI0031F99D50